MFHSPGVTDTSGETVSWSSVPSVGPAWVIPYSLPPAPGQSAQLLPARLAQVCQMISGEEGATAAERSQVAQSHRRIPEGSDVEG